MSRFDWLPSKSGDIPLLAGVLAAVLAVGLAVSPLIVSLPGSMYVFVEVATTFVIYGLLILGLNLQYGFAGLVNFGHVVFFAVGAYTVAILSAQNTFAGIGLGLPWPIAVVAGVGTAALVGAIVAMTSLRLRGDFLAIVTLATAEIFHSITVNFKGIFGGNVGILGIPQPVANLAQNTQTAMTAHLLLFGGLTLVTLGGITRLTNAPYGRVLRAIRADELVSRSIGKPVFSYKMQSFVYGAALAGFAGGLFALYNGAVAPGFFTIQVTVTIWIGMLLGGAANHRAVLIGLAVIMSLRLFSRFALDITPISSSAFASVRLIIIGLILVAIIRFRPAGIFGDAKQLGVDT